MCWGLDTEQRMVLPLRKGTPEAALWRLRGRRVTFWGKGIPGSQTSKCKGPEARTSSPCLRNSEKARVAGAG